MVSILKQAQDHNTKNHQIYSLLAKGYLKLGQINKAINILEKGTALNPNHGGLAVNLACLYLEQDQQQEKAFNLAQKAYSLRLDNPAVVDTLGWAFYKRGLNTRAVWLFEQALQQEPDQPLIKSHLSLAKQAKQADQ